MQIIQSITESDFGTMSLALLLILVFATVFGRVFSLIRMPKVAGEIIGGFILGPTFLGQLFPDSYKDIFFAFPEEGKILYLMYWLGLVLLMFISGFDVDFTEFKNEKKTILALCIGATAVPLVASYYLAERYFISYMGANNNITTFSLVFAIGIAVTSIPVISKIFMDLGIINSRYAKIVLSAAAIQDLFLWIILSVVTALTNNIHLSVGRIVFHVFVNIAIFVLVVMMPKLRKRKLPQMKHISADSIAFIVCFACVYIGSVFDISIMYSAFLAGLIFKNIVKMSDSVQTAGKIKDLAVAFFIPLYFGIVGFRIYLDASFSVNMFIIFLVLASVLEIASCIIAMMVIKVDFRTSLNLSIAMNARGGPGIVLATVTYDLGVISYEFFCVLILVTLISSTFAGFWIEIMHKNGKLMMS